MTHQEFNAFCEAMRQSRGWRDVDVSRALYGDARNGGNQIKRWRTLSDPPHYIALACAAVYFGAPAWPLPLDRADVVQPVAAALSAALKALKPES